MMAIERVREAIERNRVVEVTPIRSSRMARQIARHEDREAWGRVIHLTGRGHLSVVADRPDLSDHTFSEIRSVASRRLRQLDGGNDAA